MGCFLRWQLFDASLAAGKNESVRVMDYFVNHECEDDFLNMVILMYENNVIQERLDDFHWDKGMGIHPIDIDIVCSTLLHYFKKRCRWQKALHFFTQLQEYYQTASIYLVYIYNHLGNKDGSLAILQASLTQEPNNHIIMLSHALSLLKNAEYDACLNICQKVIKQHNYVCNALFN